ncbi:pyridoxal-phosphate dependent enzyme [Mycoplasma sp. P36-A1]|uniref:pyridoxal-phosphate dependent enzyme n=1 Tax=Mycoplasma sp. P36-A1 TaxID=3252900 RepID=UPI003C2AF862
MDDLVRKTMLVKNDKYTKYTANNIYLKCENLQRGGSVKLRLLQPVVQSLLKKGINKIAIQSNQNSALAIAILKQAYQFECVVILPEKASFDTLSTLANQNIKIIFKKQNETAKNLLKENNYSDYYLISEKEEVIMKEATFELVEEIIADCKDVNTILVPVANGFLTNIIKEYLLKKNYDIDVIGVRSNNYTKLSDENEIAEENYAEQFIRNNTNDIFIVSDDELIDTFIDVMQEHKILVDYSGLQSLAGSKYLKSKNKNIVCLLTSGNIDTTTLSTTVITGLKNKGRLFTFSAMLSDKPGELLEIAQVIANHKGNVVEISHNQFKSVSRKSEVELVITVESIDLNHKFEICSNLEELGYSINLLDDHLGGGRYV